MQIAVTGATGHVGANLVRTLVQGGHQVRALVHANNRRGLEGVACEFVDGDVLDRPSLTRAFGGCERVFHLAARISIAPGDERRSTPSTPTARTTSSPPAKRRASAAWCTSVDPRAVADAARSSPSTRRAR